MKKIYFVIIVIALFLVFGYSCSNSNKENEITFRVSDGFIQWQYEGETEWNNLISLEELKGEDGLPGKDGVDGKDGLTPFIGENGNWWIGNIDTGVFAGYKNPSVPMTGNFEFAANTDGKSYYVSKYKGNDRIVYIPDVFNGYPVTSIGTNSFLDNLAIEKILIPKTIETIYSSAFSGVENLKSIDFEEDIKLISIGDYAFYGCSSLTSITIP
ncbi:MAG: leucine-rich repeat protein, partial [Bacilli bacterium]